MTEKSWVVSQKTMKALPPFQTGDAAMKKEDQMMEKLHKEIANFRKTMEELYLLKQVAADLKSFKRMLKLKRYD